jgi:hypothetical protein
MTIRQRALPSTSHLTSSGGGSTGPRDQRAGQLRGWPAPATLSAIPLAAGSLRLVQLAGGPDLNPADDRFTRSPAALVVHIVGAAVFALLRAVQFVPRTRRHHSRSTSTIHSAPVGAPT